MCTYLIKAVIFFSFLLYSSVRMGKNKLKNSNFHQARKHRIHWASYKEEVAAPSMLTDHLPTLQLLSRTLCLSVFVTVPPIRL